MEKSFKQQQNNINNKQNSVNNNKSENRKFSLNTNETPILNTEPLKSIPNQSSSNSKSKLANLIGKSVNTVASIINTPSLSSSPTQHNHFSESPKSLSSMSYDENDYSHLNESLNTKKSLKNSFLNSFKSAKRRSKSKLSASPSLQSTFEEAMEKSAKDDLISSDIYPVSSNNSSFENSFRNSMDLKMEKGTRHKPIPRAFKNASFSSSTTSSSPPSPHFNRVLKRQSKFTRNSVDTELTEQNEQSTNQEDKLNKKENYEDSEEEDEANNHDANFSDKKSHHTLNQASNHQHHHHHHHLQNLLHRNRSRSKSHHDKLGSKIATGVCAASTSFSMNSDYDEEDFMDAFRVFDTDGDGRITAKELKNVLKELGIKMSKQDIKKMIKELDNDGNGTIEYSGKKI